jgi:protein-S-isoprenylcysteine O-methyltransferase Ste14
MRALAFVYGIACYALSLGVMLGAVAFVGDLVPSIPVSIDRGVEEPSLVAAGIDVALLAFFFVQHSVMARPWFKRAWARLVPPVTERSTYVLFSSLALFLLLAYLRRRRLEDFEFRVAGLYRLVRHPLMLGLLVAFWASPTMTVGHVLFSLSMTGYVLVALRLEESELVAAFGDAYRGYQAGVPMILPFPRPSGTQRERQ